MNNEWLARVRVGDFITAELLNNIQKAVNANTRAIRGPKSKTNLDEIYKSTGTSGSGGGLSDLSFTEISRAETTVVITDSNLDTHNIDQIDQVVLQNASGDTLTLNFTN